MIKPYEIEQLSRKLADQARVIGQMKSEAHKRVEYYERVMAEGQQRIADLEGALVEERIAGEFSEWIENQCQYWDIDEEPFCVELDGPCEYHEGKCPISMELHRIAREQLRREGKL